MSKKNRDRQQEVIIKYKRKVVSARTDNQKKYIKAIQKNDFIVCNGPAGVGKTHIAIGMAFWSLFNNEVEKIIIARPVVESGENLGFLPGDLNEKMAPYIQPIMDELNFYASYSEITEMRNSGNLEICPIAYMRGRTFNNSFIICDECQNATSKQIKMMFTRFGVGSKQIMTGDIEQSDLDRHSSGAFKNLYERFDRPELLDRRIACVKLEKKDICRYENMEIMMQAYENPIDKNTPLPYNNINAVVQWPDDGIADF